MASIQKRVAENLRRLRKKAGLTQQELADRTEMSIRYVNYLENNDTNLTLEVLERLANGLGVPMAALLGEMEPALPAVQYPRAIREALHQAQSLISSVLEGIGGDNPPPKKGRVARGRRRTL